jgi:NAD(P)-dependent dehydrogenase (short-subunit alcohol dehydrogenase family)
VTDEDGVSHTIAQCDAEFGPLNGFVNSASIGADVACLDTTTDLFRTTIEVNLAGTFVAVATRRMQELGRVNAIAQRRYGTPDELAGAATFMLDRKSSYITGQTICVDGGLAAAGIMGRSMGNAALRA